MSLPVVVGDAAELEAGSPVVDPRPLGIWDWAFAKLPARTNTAVSMIAVVLMETPFARRARDYRAYPHTPAGWRSPTRAVAGVLT
jgi:hypothetical protein